MTAPYQICSRCVMDTTEIGIHFDEMGRCSSCTNALTRLSEQLLPLPEREAALQKLVDAVRADGVGKRYDCIIGVSGGLDSTMVAVKVKELGLRPLAVHFDNGWNSELAVANIRRLLEHYDIDLETLVVDWEEFRDLQLCFIRAGLANAEAPTDHALTALLFRTAAREGLRFILSGSNLATESIMPLSSGHYNQDLRLLQALHRRFGTVPLRTTPTISLFEYVYYVFWRRIRQIPFLNYIDYRKEDAKSLFARTFNFRDYGGKHDESIWTRFFQSYYLPVRFGFDKRRAYFSSLICSGQLTRDAALVQLESPPYEPVQLRRDLRFVQKKFGLDDKAWQDLMAAPTRVATEYPSHHFLFHTLRRYKNLFRRLATSA